MKAQTVIDSFFNGWVDIQQNAGPFLVNMVSGGIITGVALLVPLGAIVQVQDQVEGR